MTERRCPHVHPYMLMPICMPSNEYLALDGSDVMMLMVVFIYADRAQCNIFPLAVHFLLLTC